MNSNKVCPVEGAGGLDNKLRRLFQNPVKLLRPFVEGDMSVLDFGCGPGFFTIDIAKMLGEKGNVTAVDLQQGMLDKLEKKIRGTHMEQKIRLHKCGPNRIDLTEKFDLILAFYMIHEVPDQDVLFQEFRSLLKPGGKVLIVEPKFHVSKESFHAMTEKIRKYGYEIVEQPRFSLSRSLVIEYNGLQTG